ncbi:MAG: hypothetical protein KDD67_15675 [Ignavibacteriae bacterium]|nr:hypothetical protein [Ignavibacteriota bacterium]MCB9215739.1 hypothetical protein [Ignavibacteria bacterium]
MPTPSPFFPSESVFTVDADGTVFAGQQRSNPNDQSYDLSVIEFLDDGSFAEPAQLERTLNAIEKARTDNPNGALVLLFIHGWHHNAAWDINDSSGKSGDTHFRSFREILRHLTLREAERYFQHASGRRIVGIYLGWSGAADGWLAGLGPLKNLSFWDRYETAENIGKEDSLRKALQGIVAAVKDPLKNTAVQTESPLILIGHSMGALMLESAFLSLLRAKDQPLLRPQRSSNDRGVTIQRNGQSFCFPDVLIALNSAADSRIAQEILLTLKDQKFSKKAAVNQLDYSPPMLISATSEADSATGQIWRLAQGINFRRRTDGHDDSLFTHSLERTNHPCSCKSIGGVDFGQDWHCLRPPYPSGMPTPSFAIDLPVRKRERDVEDQHERYELCPLGEGTSDHLAWVFQVPEEIINDHNDIFNFKSTLLVLALIQISGATMSLAEDWSRNFEPE